MCNYMHSLRRAQLVQDGKGLEAVKENERASFSIVSCKPKWGVPRQIWRLLGVGRGLCCEHCFSAAWGCGSNIRLFSSPLKLHVSINTYWIECQFLRREMFGNEPPTAWAEITKSGTHLLVNHSRLTYSILCPTCFLTYGKWMRF